jgi:asparagine N-glycosylation enzyme membrane subunit Stt3
MWNDNEISIYFVNRDESLLLLRTSNNISNVWWHPNGTYIFYQTNDDINLIELDERDKRNNYYFSSREIDAPFIINNQGTAVYSYSHDSQTFYRINIQ